MKNKSIAVIGLGQFGLSMVEELVKHDADLLVIDSNPDLVKKVSYLVPAAFVADATDEKALRELDISRVDNAIVAFGNNIQATILTTVMLKELGVKKITVRVDDEEYTPIIKRLGADEILSPQRIAAISFANRLESSSFLDYYLISDSFSAIKISVSSSFEKQLLSEIDPRNKLDCNIILITRDNKTFAPKGHDLIQANDIIFVVGKSKDIEKLDKYLNK